MPVPDEAAARLPAGDSFAALDFETADHGSDSACALGIVTVEGRRIVRRRRWLIRPPRRHFVFTYIHGITWSMVAGERTFAEVWPEIRAEMLRVRFLAAHNASFDRDVLDVCCHRAGARRPPIPFLCTVRLARRSWGIYPTNLPSVCEVLGVGLDHHEPLSDAEACARIVLAAGRVNVQAELSGRPRPARWAVT